MNAAPTREPRAAAAPAEAAKPNEAIDFQRDIAPIFANHCAECHGRKNQKAGLRLDARADALRGGDSGKVIQPGKAKESLLFQLVTQTDPFDPDAVMPPKGDRLSDKQIELLRRWINDGANWPDDGDDKPARLTSDHWAYQPVRKPKPPDVRDEDWPRNAIDRFVLARLEARGLSPAPPAERATLIRRLSFDLIGLPPTPDEVDAFVRDESPDAYEKLIDRLLASPHYGERWARHWLDVARFTESQGFERDKLRDNAWHYRDYVIRSFNADKPYDQFVKEQIAGDAMQPVTSDGIVATSLLVCGSWDEVGANQQSKTGKAVVREEELEGLIGVVSQTFLGTTINCARCHAHKFDPVPQRDYYRFKSVFEGVRHGERSIASAGEVAERDRRAKELNGGIAAAREELAALERDAREKALAKQEAARDEKQDAAAVGKAVGPSPIARWSFDTGGANDVVGDMHGSLHGGAAIREGKLVLDGKGAFLRTKPLAKDIHAKTLEGWLTLPTLDQGGGGAITLETGDGRTFDSIVFAERQPRKWVAGSNNFARTRDLNAQPETAKPGELVHMAITYAADGTVTVYRNGESYGQPYKTAAPPTYRTGDARVLLGMRHTGGGRAFLNAAIERASLYDRALSADEVKASFASHGSYVSRDAMLAAMTHAQRDKHAALTKQITALRREIELLPTFGKSYVGTRTQPPPTKLLTRGDVTKPADVIAPGAMSVITQPSPDFDLPPDAPEAKRRLALAEWIADPRHPLTARVMANRVWHYHFGRGIVATPNDFGAQGASPTHPQLLDHLAAAFVERGWSIKELHKLIVTSATYRQSSRFDSRAASIDADNTLLWRFEPRRVEGEAVRDAMLAVSGQLNRKSGGPSFRPFDVFVDNTHFYLLKDDGRPEFNRLTIYRMHVNSGKDPMLEALDCPDPAVKTPRRRVTVTPLSALSLMNNAFVQRQAKHFAERVKTEAGGDFGDAVSLAYRYALNRSPTDDEHRDAVTHAREHGLKELCWVLLNATEFQYVR